MIWLAHSSQYILRDDTLVNSISFIDFKFSILANAPINGKVNRKIPLESYVICIEKLKSNEVSWLASKVVNSGNTFRKC